MVRISIQPKREIVWYNVIVLLLWHAGFVYALYRYLPVATWMEIGVHWIGFWVISGLGITAGAHRLWSHRSYRATEPLRVFLMLANAMAFQGSILEWSRDHRIHHKGSETDADPHNAKRGLFFSHMGWVMVRKHPEVIRQGKLINIEDLKQDWVVQFQRQYYFPLVLLCCYGIPTGIGYLLGNSWHGFWIGGVFRHVWVLHMTWFVNSVAHLWGDRPYALHINPAENLIVSIGAIGEGWHNYHHKYPSDYATGEWGISQGQWNPTKLFIDFCAWIGLASDLKRSRTAKATREKVLKKKQFLASKQPTPSHWTEHWMDRLFFGRSNEDVF